MAEKNQQHRDAGKDSISYSAFHKGQFLSGLIFIVVGVLFVIYYDYGMILFLFAFPVFFLTGFIPFLVGLLIIFRQILEYERVVIKKEDDQLLIESSWFLKNFRSHTKKYSMEKINHVGLRFRETRTKRWLIIAILILLTVEVFWQNSIDLMGYARIAPILLWGAVFMVAGIILFTFTPRRYLEVSTDEELINIVFQSHGQDKYRELLELFKISSKNITLENKKSVIRENILHQFSSFLFSLFLIILGIILLFPQFFFGYFTRVVVFIYGLKLLLRVVNADSFFRTESEGHDDNLYFGRSPRPTFMRFYNGEKSDEISYNIIRFHVFEILAIFYLLSQAIKFGFRPLWYTYTTLNPFYFLLSITLLIFGVIRWFLPVHTIIYQYNHYSVKLNLYRHENIQNREVKTFLYRKISDFCRSFQKNLTNSSLQISIIVFIGIFVLILLYYFMGGNFLLL